MMPTLDELKALFDRHRQEWLREGHTGQWAVVTASGLHGIFNSYEEAFLAANRAFGDELYLIQEILEQDRIESIQVVFWG